MNGLMHMKNKTANEQLQKKYFYSHLKVKGIFDNHQKFLKDFKGHRYEAMVGWLFEHNKSDGLYLHCSSQEMAFDINFREKCMK